MFVSDMMVVDRGFELQYKVSGNGPFTLTESEREIDVTFRWVPRKSNLLFTSSGDKDKIEKFIQIFLCMQMSGRKKATPRMAVGSGSHHRSPFRRWP